MCSYFGPGCTVFAELLILLPCNNESYLLQIPKKGFVHFLEVFLSLSDFLHITFNDIHQLIYIQSQSDMHIMLCHYSWL